MPLTPYKHLQVTFFALLCFSSSLTGRSFMISCWVPYWRCASAIQMAQDHIALFNQVSPFSYEVKAEGALRDPFKKNGSLWEPLREACARTNTLFVPTIFWTDTQEMQKVFSDKVALKKHKSAILELVHMHRCDGININYERVPPQVRGAYISFLEGLSKELHRNKKVLHISIGGRTSDWTVGLLTDAAYKKSMLPRLSLVSVSLSPGSGGEARRYKRVIAQCCDQVHIMGYDEWGTPYKANRENLANEYYVSHASNQWIEQIIKYALTYIPRHKLVLGVPTHGLEFNIFIANGTISFKKRRNISFKAATELSYTMQKKPQRTAGGELSFTYQDGEEYRYACYLSAQSIKEKIALAKKYRIKGINLFTVNGNEDPLLWETLEKELLFSSLT